MLNSYTLWGADRDNYNNVINYNVTKTALKYQIQVRITLKGVRSTLKGGIYGFNR